MLNIVEFSSQPYGENVGYIVDAFYETFTDIPGSRDIEDGSSMVESMEQSSTHEYWCSVFMGTTELWTESRPAVKKGGGGGLDLKTFHVFITIILKWIYIKYHY